MSMDNYKLPNGAIVEQTSGDTLQDICTAVQFDFGTFYVGMREMRKHLSSAQSFADANQEDRELALVLVDALDDAIDLAQQAFKVLRGALTEVNSADR